MPPERTDADDANLGSEPAAPPTADDGADAEVERDDELADPDDDFGPPFEAKTFGAALVWARAPGYVCSVLRVHEGGNVVVSTRSRKDMVVMLTGGRAVLEIRGAELEQIELEPAIPHAVDPTRAHRLIAITEVEIFTVYTPLED